MPSEAPGSSSRSLRPKRLKGLLNIRGSGLADTSDRNDDERRGFISNEIQTHHEGDTTPLYERVQGVQTWIYQGLATEHVIPILKCGLAYVLGSLATFVPALSALLGHQDGKHMVATVTVYFHPARTQGSMYRASICALLAFCYSAFLSITSMLVENLFQDTFDLPVLGHALVLIVFCGGGLGFVLKMVIMGVVIAMAVSFLIFPTSARKDLRKNLVKAADTLATMLSLITASFLDGSEEILASEKFLKAERDHRQAYNKLDGLIRDAKLEHFLAGTEKEYRLEKRLVRWVQDITHNMGGLRSAAALQFSLIREPTAADSDTPTGIATPNAGEAMPLQYSWSYTDGSFLEPIEERPEEDLTDGNSTHESVFSPAGVFSIFIQHLGRPMHSLAFTLKEIFNEIPFGPAPDYKVSVDSRLRISLDRALDLYRQRRREALKLLYQQTEAMRLKGPDAEADLEEISASCGHFSFSLLEFGEQLHELLTILDELQLETEERPNGRSWGWIKFWRVEKPSETAFLNRKPSAPVTEATIKQRIGYRLWKSLEIIRRDDIKYAIKVGLGAALYALPAFLPSTRPFYQRWRGEWGLLSYMLGNGPLGRFIMLTYNLSVLYAYSLTQKEADDPDEGGDHPIITEIALHRVVAVLSGCIWGIIITRIVWPISARSRLKEALSSLWLRLALVWKRDPLSVMATSGRSAVYMTARERLLLERSLSRLESLRVAAGSEFELKSAFADIPYANILRARSMVNAFDAMNLELLKNETATEGEMRLLKYTARERQQLSARISHLLIGKSADAQHVLRNANSPLVMASSMKLEYPLSDVLPSVDHARDRLLARIYHFQPGRGILRHGGRRSRFAVCV
ncbi:hypothetical protein N7470_010069 [Penicillium chermesinum]|nr:hypothetical protein N7470_010069 [Penicillium chermesinum]